ncbi:MAG: hypothetical protein M0008_03325 [Actinomycetota bacterium]|nr:hypothetical protein [Actinomycetota bacterium]
MVKAQRAAVVVAVFRRPALWCTAILQVLRLARPGWWRRWPPFPTPDPAYWQFRMETAYGTGSAFPEPGDVVEYLRWCRGMKKLLRERYRD